MVEAIGCCMICRKSCFPRVWLCGTCYEGNPELQAPFAEWPEWARDLEKHHQAERVREQEILDNELELPQDVSEWLDRGE
jgi:hypothetical protein